MRPKAATDIDLAVGARISALRKIRGLSQTALGEALGVTFQQIQKYERGQNRIGASRLREVAKFFGVPVVSLFGDDAEATTQSDTFALLQLPGAVELLKAFVTIKNAELRRNVVAIAKTAARICAGPVAVNE
jgi:transcriptional regulator with XRE-family HTH domain